MGGVKKVYYIVQAICFGIVLLLTNWEHQAKKVLVILMFYQFQNLLLFSIGS